MPACLPRKDRSRWGLRDKQNSSSSGDWNIGEKKWRAKKKCFMFSNKSLTFIFPHTVLDIIVRAGERFYYAPLLQFYMCARSLSLFFDEFNIRRSVECGKLSAAKNNTQLETTTMSSSASGSLVKKAPTDNTLIDCSLIHIPSRAATTTSKLNIFTRREIIFQTCHASSLSGQMTEHIDPALLFNVMIKFLSMNWSPRVNTEKVNIEINRLFGLIAR